MSKEFTCPDCGGHHLKVIVEVHADVMSLDDERGLWFRGDKEQNYEIALYYCDDCEWDTDEEGSMMENVK